MASRKLQLLLLPLPDLVFTAAVVSQSAADHPADTVQGAGAPVKVLIAALVLDKAAALLALCLDIVVAVLFDVRVNDGHQLAPVIC